MFSQDVEILVFTAHVHARKDIVLYLFCSRYLAPICVIREHFTRPEACKLAGIRTRHIISRHPAINTRPLVAQSLRWREDPVESRQDREYFALFAPQLTLFFDCYLQFLSVSRDAQLKNAEKPI